LGSQSFGCADDLPQAQDQGEEAESIVGHRVVKAVFKTRVRVAYAAETVTYDRAHWKYLRRE
jgi:hypothetical protein